MAPPLIEEIERVIVRCDVCGCEHAEVRGAQMHFYAKHHGHRHETVKSLSEVARLAGYRLVRLGEAE